MKKYTVRKACGMAGTVRRYWWEVLNANGDNASHCLFETRREALAEVARHRAIDNRIKEALS